MSKRTIDVDTLSALVDAAGKWANELSEFIIPEAAATDEAGYTDELQRINSAMETARGLCTQTSGTST